MIKYQIMDHQQIRMSVVRLLRVYKFVKLFETPICIISSDSEKDSLHNTEEHSFLCDELKLVCKYDKNNSHNKIKIKCYCL